MDFTTRPLSQWLTESSSRLTKWCMVKSIKLQLQNERYSEEWSRLQTRFKIRCTEAVPSMQIRVRLCPWFYEDLPQQQRRTLGQPSYLVQHRGFGDADQRVELVLGAGVCGSSTQSVRKSNCKTFCKIACRKGSRAPFRRSCC